MGAGFESSLEYLYGLQSHGIKPGLSRTIALLGALGDPQASFRVFHVGGTNGKGSTAAMLASVLSRQGYRVGLYTSPHLVDFTERIRVDGETISPTRVLNLTQAVRHAAETRLSEPPTFFEATTAMAFTYFAEAGVEYAVIEVGLGGRFDATNVLFPLVSVITTIGLDHQQYLGETPEAIAGEKAGIIKRNVPVITGRLGAGPLSVVRATAAARQASCFSLGRDFDIIGESPSRFSYRGVWQSYEGLSCPLAGRHQLDNAACALAALETAMDRGVRVGEGAVRDGFRTVRWHGRLELVGRNPDILLDGAHNPDAADALAAHLTALQARRSSSGGGRLILVVGMMRDKDMRGVLSRLAAVPGVSHLILTQAAHPRAARPEDLAREGADLDAPILLGPTVGEAFARAKTLAGPTDTICVTGSLLVVGEVKAVLDGTTVSALRG
jgi:dihydrofolate synthase/folylpolyglutamate synthase